MAIQVIDDEQKNGKTNVIFCLDETGSMMSVFDTTVKGYNEYIQSLKQNPDILFTLIRFNNIKGASIALHSVPISNVQELTDYAPNGMTPLYDAFGRAIEIGDSVKDGKVLVVCQSDGEENDSKEYTLNGLKSVIKERNAKPNWTITFLGVGIENWKGIGQALGLSSGNLRGVDRNQVGATFSDLAGQTLSYSYAGSSKTANFFDKEDK